MTSDLAFFDQRAAQWEVNCYPPPVRERLCRLIDAFDVRPSERVLDVGTGPGVLIPYLRDRVGPRGQVCAMDLSLEMVRIARHKEFGPRGGAVRADVLHLPFRSEGFDRVICFAAFPHFSDALAALTEMARVTRKGGRVVVAHLMSRDELARLHAAQGAVAQDRLPEAARMSELFDRAGLRLPDIVDRPGRYLAAGVRK